MGSWETHPGGNLTGCHDALLGEKGTQTKRHHQHHQRHHHQQHHQRHHHRHHHHQDHQVIVILIMRYICWLKHGGFSLDSIGPW